MNRKLMPTISLFGSLMLLAGCSPAASSNGTSAPAEEATPIPEATPPAEPSYKPLSIDQALTRFGACMERTRWDELGMPDVAYQGANSAAGGGRCYSCHYTGTGGAYLSNDEDAFFSMNTQRPFILKLVLGTVNEAGQFDDLVPALRFRERGDESMHPKYILTEEREQALITFVEETLVRYHDYEDSCGMP